MAVQLTEHHFLKLRDNEELHTHIHESGKRQWLIVTHGIGEHLRRHNYLIDLFKEHYNIFQYDLRGHGRSQGRRGHIKEFNHFVQDLVEILHYLRDEFAMEKFSLFGHSMGALITASYLQNSVSEKFYPTQVFLSAPPVGVSGILGDIVKMLPLSTTKMLHSLNLTLKVTGLVDLKNLSHNKLVYEDYIKDELNILALHTKLLLGLVHTSNCVFARPIRPKCPLYVAVGSEDKIVNTKMLINYFEQIEKASQLCIIKGGFHELHNEINKYRDPYFEFLKSSLIHEQ